MKKLINITLAIFIFLFLILSPANVCLSADEVPLDVIELQVPIFDYAQSRGLPEYIATLFQYAMIVLVPLAIVMIIWGGIQWVSAAGNSQKIGQAKKQITNAFLGLLLGLLTYTMLSFVGITQLYMPGLQSIQKEEGDDLFMYEGTDTSPGSYPSMGGQCFPVAANSFVSNSNNFKATRAGGGRYHAGVDLITKSPGIGVAIADGVVTRISTTFKAGDKKCTRTPNWFISQYGARDAGAILIYHPSADITVNYGENWVGDVKVKVGDNVTAGQVLGTFGPCRMIHFEMYKGRTTNTTPWYTGQPQPQNLLDPSLTLKELSGKMCGD